MTKLTKQLFVLFLLGSLTIFSSCNDSEEGDNFVATELTGTWTYNSFDYTATINGIDFLKWFSDAFGAPESAFEEDFDDLGDDFNEFSGIIMTFNEGGTVVASSPGEADEEGTWLLDEENQILTVTLDGEPLELEVLTLTSSALVVAISESSSFFDLDQDGEAEVLEVMMTIGLKK